MNAHFFDFDTLVTINSKVWIVNRHDPNNPIVKIPKSEFNLIKNGIYRSDNIKFELSGKEYWISKILFDNIKVKCKRMNTDISNLAFSMQEFMNEEIIKSGSFIIHKENIQHLKNSKDDIYIICSKNTKETYKKAIDKIELELEKLGLTIYNYYYISETFYNRDKEEIINKKSSIILKHLLGHNINGNMFDDVSIKKYNNITLYDTESTINSIKNINNTLHYLIDNTQPSIVDDIKNIIKNDEPLLITNIITFNNVNKFIRNEIELKWQNIKKFENFKY